MGSLEEKNINKIFIFSTFESRGWSANNKNSTSMKNIQPYKFQPFVVERNLEFKFFLFWQYLHLLLWVNNRLESQT